MFYRDKVKIANPTAYQIIKNAIKSNKVAHAFLFAAPKKVEIEDEPMFLIQSLITEDPFETEKPRKVESYLDLTVIDGSADLIKKEQVLVAIERLQKTPFETFGKKILLIKNVENANSQSLNSLLKFIEEPTKDTYIIMTTNNVSAVLTTIRSRSQVIALKAKSLRKYEIELMEAGIKPAEAKVLSKFTTTVAEAKEIAKEDFGFILDEISDVMEDSLRDRNIFFTHFEKRVSKKNFVPYLNALNVFINDIWKSDEGLELAFEREDILHKYAISKFDYAQALKEINDFFVMQDYYVNFDLYKTQLLLKIARCYA